MYLAVSDNAVSSVLIRTERGGIKTHTLPQQHFGGCRNTILTLGENRSSLSACHEEITALLPSPHHLDTDRAFITIPVEKI